MNSVDSVSVIASGSLPHTGIYTLPAGSTLAEVIDVVLPHSGTAVEFVIRPVDSAGPEAQRIDLNHAEPWLLEALPGIGEKRAAGIVDYREKYGGFTAPEELLFVQGIGPVTYDAVEDLVTVTPFSSDVTARP